MKYTGFDNYMKQRFGGKIYRLSLSTGCTCPNRDGRCGTGGCIFCSAGGSGEFAAGGSTTAAGSRSGSSGEFAPDWCDLEISGKSVESAAERGDSESAVLSDRDGGPEIISADIIRDSVYRQIEDAKQRVAAKLSRSFAGYMAYFQSFTNTYFHDDKEFMGVTARFFAAAGHPEVAAVSIATRPDCLPPEVLGMLAELNKVKPVLVELGLQTMHDETARLINRGYDTAVYDKAVADLHEIGIGVVTHMIIGLPGETEDMMAETLGHIVSACSGTEQARLSFPDGVKIQILQILKGTRLAELTETHALYTHSYTLEEYAALLDRLLPLIPPGMIVHRLTGDPPKSLLISPQWTADKKRVLNTIKKALEG